MCVPYTRRSTNTLRACSHAQIDPASNFVMEVMPHDRLAAAASSLGLGEDKHCLEQVGACMCVCVSPCVRVRTCVRMPRGCQSFRL
jgi:hypothetical protein